MVEDEKHFSLNCYVADKEYFFPKISHIHDMFLSLNNEYFPLINCNPQYLTKFGEFIHHSFLTTVTSRWARWRLKSPGSRLFTQPLFRHRSKKTQKLRVTGLCEGNSPVTREFTAQRASNAEIVSIWWGHHDQVKSICHFPLFVCLIYIYIYIFMGISQCMYMHIHTHIQIYFKRLFYVHNWIVAYAYVRWIRIG